MEKMQKALDEVTDSRDTLVTAEQTLQKGLQGLVRRLRVVSNLAPEVGESHNVS